MMFNPERKMFTEVNESKRKKEKKEGNIFPSFFDDIVKEDKKNEGNEIFPSFDSIFPAFFDDLPDIFGEDR